MRYNADNHLVQKAIRSVYLNGDVQKYVIWADTTLGEIERAKLDSNGQLQHIDGSLVREAVTGCVGIGFNPGWDVRDGKFYFNGQEIK